MIRNKKENARAMQYGWRIKRKKISFYFESYDPSFPTVVSVYRIESEIVLEKAQ